jgi:hypothetical protein
MSSIAARFATHRTDCEGSLRKKVITDGTATNLDKFSSQSHQVSEVVRASL